MNYQIFTLVFDYITANNFNLYFQENYIKNLRYSNKEFNNWIKENKLYSRKKSAYLLTKTFIGIGYHNINNILVDSYDLKYIFNSLDVYGSYGRDPGYEYYLNSLSNYKTDPFNPLKSLRLFTKIHYDKSMKKSIYLNLALSHADKPPYYLRLKEIDGYSNGKK